MIYAVDAIGDSSTIVEKVSFSLDKPYAGYNLDDAASFITINGWNRDCENDSTNNIKWYEGNEVNDDKVVTGKAGYYTQYTAKVSLSVPEEKQDKDSYKFNKSTQVYFVGNTIPFEVSDDGYTITFVKTFDFTQKDLLQSITSPSVITVDDGATLDSSILPDSIVITTKGESVDSASVTWDTSLFNTYDPNKDNQTFTVTGTVKLHDPVANDNNVDTRVKVDVTVDKNVIYLTYLDENTVIANSKNEISFKSNAEFDDFEKMLVDEKEIDEVNYDTKEGSIIVTLKASYLDALKEGKHTIAIVSTNGIADGSFIVKKAASIPTSDPVVNNNPGNTTDDGYVVPNTGVK